MRDYIIEFLDDKDNFIGSARVWRETAETRGGMLSHSGEKDFRQFPPRIPVLDAALDPGGLEAGRGPCPPEVMIERALAYTGISPAIWVRCRTLGCVPAWGSR